LKIVTWNINGIRARFGEVTRLAAEHAPDVMCFQEIKATAAQVPEPLTGLPGYHNFYHGAPGGYSGVSIHIRRSSHAAAPRYSHPDFDIETRIAVAELPHLRIASVYVPNGNKDYDAKLRFLEGMRDWVRDLATTAGSVLVCGDLNVARSDADLHPNHRKADTIGQRDAERELIESTIDLGAVDVLRDHHADREDVFTWWPPWREEKAKNRGWRIDYILASPDLARRVTDCQVLDQFGTSDHAPVMANIGVA
jgi:exodeoxyribonuclease-3